MTSGKEASGGHWSNSNCSDPKELFESIVFKPKDVIDSIGFEYWTKPEDNKYSIDEFKDWYTYDDARFGRCATLALSHEQTQSGIKEINLRLHANSTVHIHTPGMFSKGSKQLSSFIEVELGTQQILEVYHEVHELLNYGGALCNNDRTYQMDGCNNNGIEKKSLETVGCTTPYGPNKTKICTDANKGQKALEIYWKFIYSFSEKNYEGCFYPCSYFRVSTKKSIESHFYPNSALVVLNFEQLIQETKTYYTYSELSMIAEIGGYVGLFLGISVNQIPYLFDILGLSFARIHSVFKF